MADVTGAHIAGGIGAARWERKLSRAGADELSRDSEERGLAGAVPAGEDGAFARGDLKRNAAESVESAVAFVDALEAETSWR
jgi:hypothetical protein